MESNESMEQQEQMEFDQFSENMEDASTFTPTDDELGETKSIIKVIGVGGGGSNAVNYMFKQDIPLINYVAVNTDRQHLKRRIVVPRKMLIGDSITHGLGAGNIPDVGRKCAEASADDIKALFDDETEMVFITAGMGGGTGTGAAPVIARLAREAGKLTIGIVTVPFLFEGEKKILKALDGAKEMQKYVDALLVINNENLVEIYPDFSIFNSFEKADETLANAARSISEIISEECYINVDFQDVRTTLKDSGSAIISTAYGEGEHRITDAIDNALHSPLLKRHDITTSQRLLIKFSINKESKNALKAGEIKEIQSFTDSLPKTIDVKWGIADNPDMGDKVKVTILASGFKVTLRDDENKSGVVTFGGDTGEEELTKGGDVVVDMTPADDDTKKTSGIEEIYGAGIASGMMLNRLRQKSFIFLPEEFDDDDIITSVERIPTKQRDKRENDRIHDSRRKAAEPQRPADNDRPAAAGTIQF